MFGLFKKKVKTTQRPTVDEIAKVCHEVNKAYCEAIGEDGQSDWENAPSWQKDSARNGVQFHLANPESQPRDSHDSWLSQKRAGGWKYGKVKDEKKKTHPCMVKFEELPKEQQVKDYLFLSVVRVMESMRV